VHSGEWDRTIEENQETSMEEKHLALQQIVAAFEADTMAYKSLLHAKKGACSVARMRGLLISLPRRG